MRCKGEKLRMVWLMVAALGLMAGAIPWAAAEEVSGATPEVVEASSTAPVMLTPDWDAADDFVARAARGPEAVSEEEIILQTADHEIGQARLQGRVSVLVYTEPVQARGIDAKPAVKQFATERQGHVKYEYGTVLPNVMNIRNIPQNQVAALAQMPGVTKVELDEYHPNLVSLHDATPLVRALQSQITGAGLSATGAGVRVCVTDTGIDSDHLMYASRIDTAAGYDFYNDDTNPEDDHGHGSHVSGIAVGGTGLNVDFGCGAGAQPFQGMAPQATLIGVKILNASGGGYDSDIIAGINYCADQTPTGARADVINMSIGTGNYVGACTHSWAVAANNAVANGVVTVAASGNENRTNSMGSPACGINVIAVGAVYKADYPTCEDNITNWAWGVCTDNSPNQDQIVCFSNEADLLWVTAPGANIWSASNAAGGGSITGMSGTSMASPAVAGLAALILSADPSLTPAEVRQIIRDGAVDLGTAGFDRAYGWGRIDAINSLLLVGGTPCTSDPQCDDGLWCNGAETCNLGTGQCQAGTAPNCNDGVACTTDSCNEGTDSCNHVPNNAACDDGLFCNGAETCNATLGCQAGTDPCAPEPCNETNDTCGAGAEVWVAFTANVTVPVVGTVTNEDIVAYNMGTGTWSLIFDGSDVGLSAFAIDGMALLPSGDILLSFTAAGTVGGIAVDDSDIVRFTPTSRGATTAGTFSWYFDGSDVGLTTNDEDVDAIGLTSSGQLIVSVIGNFAGTGASGVDADLFLFNATSLGSTTAGSFQMYFDGSDVGLTTTNEDVDAAGLTSSGSILLSTLGNFSVPGVSGANEDIFEFSPTSLGSTTSGTYQMFLDLSTVGIATSADVIAVELIE